MTSNDLCVTFDPYPWTSYIKQGQVILLTKYGGPGSLFVKQVAFYTPYIQLSVQICQTRSV